MHTTPILLMAAAALAAGDDDWKIDEAHGPVHEVSLDLDEGTWMSVTVHGDTVVFDLLGDLWSVPLAGGEATRLTEGPAWDVQPAFSPDGSQLAFTSDRGGNENVWIMDADGSDPRPLTKEEQDARVTHPVWDPSGDWMIVRRRTVDTRSIGVTELWQVHLDGGSGFALTKKDEHPHAGEAWPHDRYVYFSTRHGRFSYNQDPVAGLWDIVRLDRRSGDLRAVAHGPGSASHPVVSPDGSQLVFLSRERTQTLLEVLDLRSGRRRVLARDLLSPDELEGFSLHGTYPRMDWTDDGELVLWAQGKLWRLSMDGQRAEIPFRAKGTWTQHDVSRWAREIPDEVRARVLRWPTLSSRGALAFSAMGRLWIRTPDGTISRLGEGTGYAPAWSPDGKTLAWTSWSDADGGRLHLTGPSGRTDTLPLEGQLSNPAWSDDGEQLVLLRGLGGSVVPDTGAEPAYEIVLLTRGRRGTWTEQVVTGVGNFGPRAPKLHLHDGRVWYVEARHEEPRSDVGTYLVSVKLDGTDPRDHLKLPGAQEVAISPDFTRLAYKADHQLHVAALPHWGGGTVEVGTLPTKQVTKVVGDWLAWTPDGGAVTWVEGPVFRQLPVDGLWDETPDDGEAAEGDEAEEDWFVEPDGIVSTEIVLTVPRARPEGLTLLKGARVIPMTGDEVLENVDILVRGDRIAEIGPNLAAPVGAEVIDLAGKTVMPGLVDVHAHLHFSSSDVLPEQEWRYLVNLDFGVTTLHDPSTFTDLVFTQAEMVEAGFMQGPRVYSTGAVLYGAKTNDNAKTPSLDAARAHVRRMKAVGAVSVKVYQQSQRTQRQWYLQACNEERILCVPEGGGDLWMDLGMVADGYHAIEHALPTAPLYRDVVEFFAASTGGEGDGLGTVYTPTLLVAYGGIAGDQYFFQHENPVADERLRRHYPTRVLEAKLWRRSLMAQDEDWRFWQTARDAAAVADAGGTVALGAHGQLQGLGVHYELWALAGDGAMSPLEALQAGTIEGARYLGLEGELGTVEEGKLADLLILDADPLEDIRNSTSIALVMKNGRVVR